MPNKTQEIELILAAKLDARDAVNDAPTVGQAISQSLERAFDGLGERIAEKIFRELKQGFSSFNLLDNTNTASQRHGQAGLFTDPSGRDFQEVTSLKPGKLSSSSSTGTDNPVPDRSSGGAIVDLNGPPQLQVRAPTVVDRAIQGERFPRKGMGPATILSQYLRGLSPDKALGPGFDQVASEDAFSADATVRKVQAFRRMERAGIPIAQDQFVGDDQLKRAQTTLKSDIALGASESKRLADVMEKLRSSLLENNEKLEKLKEKLASGEGLTRGEKAEMREATRTQARVEEQIDYVNQKSEMIDEASKAAEKNLGVVSGALSKPTRLQRFVSGPGIVGAEMGLNILGQTGQFISGYNMMSREGRTGSAMLENFTSRDTFEGNVDNLIATAKLGGETAARRRARFDVYTGALTKGAVGLGETILGGLSAVAGTTLMAGGGAATATGIGAPVGVPTALLGGALTLGGAAAVSKGVGTIYSGIEDVFKADSRTEQNMRTQQALKKLEDKEYMTMAMASRGTAISAFDTARGLGSDQFANFLYGGGVGGVVDSSSRFGLTAGETRQGLASYAQNIGGVYQGHNLLDTDAMKSRIIQGNLLKTQGFGSIENVTGAFYRGGQFTRNLLEDMTGAADESRALFNELKSSGMDQSQVNRLMEMTASDITGIGGREAASYNARVAAGGAQASGYDTGPERSFLLSAQQNFMSQGNTGAGLEGLSKVRAIDDLEKRYGVNLSVADRMSLQLTTATPESLERMFGKSKRFQEEGGGKAAVSELQAGFKENRLALLSNALGGEDRAKVVAGLEAGARTTTELDMAGKAIFGGDVMPKEVMGPEAPPSDLGRAEKVQAAKIDASQTVIGLQTMGDVLPLVNAGLDEMVKRLQKVSSDGMNPEGGPQIPSPPPKPAMARPASR